MITSDYVLAILAVFIGLYIIFAPTPGIDCSRYSERTFHGVVVNCDKQAVRK